MTVQSKANLETAAAAALAEARANPTAETRQAAIDASRALSQWIVTNDPPKTRGFGSKAGKRQYREHLARHGLTKYLYK